MLGRQSVGSYKAHGKLLIIDDARAVLGSMAMSALSLDFRREVSIVIEERVLVQELRNTVLAQALFFHEYADRWASTSKR